MADINKIVKRVKEVEKVAKTIAGLAAVAAPLVPIAGKALANKAEERKTLVEIPHIISLEGYVKLEKAKSYLEDAGLKAGEAVAKENIAFKDCSDFDVVGRNYKRKKRVPSGTRIILYYVTHEVIEKSKQLFIESERQKAEVEQKKVEMRVERTKKRLAQGEKNKQKIDDAVVNIKRGFIDAATNTKKRVERILSNRKKMDDT